MRLFRLTFSSIFQRKSWAICGFAVAVLPFVLPWISSASEKPILTAPARILACWGTLWVCALGWGLFTAAREGEENAKSGTGEYFLTTGVSPTRQLLEIWLAVFLFIVPLVLLAAAISQFAATPHDPQERSMWWHVNLQYAALFLLAVAPLLGLATAIASRFGGIAGFAATLGLAIYGLYGVGYVEQMLKLETNPLLKAVWTFSPQFRFADLTQRLYFKNGALSPDAFWLTSAYFFAVLLVFTAVSRLCFRPKSAL
ncbi:MAG: hypothetical protein V4733_09840 [Verrucomicrobiota bacterium]